jgi:hypothetical protein
MDELGKVVPSNKTLEKMEMSPRNCFCFRRNQSGCIQQTMYFLTGPNWQLFQSISMGVAAKQFLVVNQLKGGLWLAGQRLNQQLNKLALGTRP